MAAIKQLAAVTRSGTGKGAARSVRREGRVPGVIYGGGEKPEPISVDFKDAQQAHLRRALPDDDLRARHRGPQGARAAARLPARRRHRPAGARRLPAPARGLARAHRRAGPRAQPRSLAGPQEGRHGQSRAATRSNCSRRPTTSPRRSSVDLTGLDFHDSVHVSALKLPEGCKPAETKIDCTVVTIVPPTVCTEETPAARRDPPPLRRAAPAKAARACQGAAGPGRRARRGSGQGRRRRPAKPAGQEVTRRAAPRAQARQARPPIAGGRAFLIARATHAAHRRPRQSRRAPRPQPPQHRLHGGRGDRRRASLRPVPLALPGAGRRGADRAASASRCCCRRPT